MKHRKMTLVLALVFAGVAVLASQRQAAPQAPIVWKVQTMSTPVMLLHKAAVQIGERVKEMSGGRLVFEVFPAGTVVGAFENMDAVNKGVIDAAHSWPGYWMGKNTAAALFSGVPGGPFGMRIEDYIAWMYAGGGQDLYTELVQKDMKMTDVVPLLTMNSFAEPLGWFRKPITSLKDLRGMKMRTSGLGTDLMKEMGVATVALPGGEIVPALERGVVDAVEWTSPASDIPMGFHTVAKFLIMPSIRQPLVANEFLMNRKKWDALPADLKAIVRNAVLSQIPLSIAAEYMESAAVFQDLGPKYGVKVLPTPADVLEAEVKAAEKVLEAHAQKNPAFARVLKHQREFAAKSTAYTDSIRPPFSKMVKHYSTK